MQSINHFLVKPVGSRYNNVKDIEGKSLILNSEIQNHQYINRLAEIISCPVASNKNIKPGDIVLVHHNVFRRWTDIKGREKNSKAYFKENLYLVSEDQIFLKKHKDTWQAIEGFCFVQPLQFKGALDKIIEHPNKGVVVFTDGVFKKDQIVGYTTFSQYEFVVNGQRLFRVYNKFITIKYEYQGNEKAYNPSWAQSS